MKFDKSFIIGRKIKEDESPLKQRKMLIYSSNSVSIKSTINNSLK